MLAFLRDIDINEKITCLTDGQTDGHLELLKIRTEPCFENGSKPLLFLEQSVK